MRALAWLLLVAACNGDRDYDGDGWFEPKDCDDGDRNSYPGAEEVAYDGIDQDCDGSDLVDRDGDGFQAIEAGGPDCNDFDPESYPGAKEIPYDGVDQNCDDWNDDDYDLDGFEALGHGGEDCDDNNPVIIPLDLDGDGYSPCTGDCDEADPRRNEETTPVCGNGIDDNCDEVSDCTTVGILALETVPVGLVGSEGTAWLGAHLVAPGDLNGDGLRDLALSGQRAAEQWSVWLMTADLTEPTDESAAWGRLDVPHEPWLNTLGDLDGDGLAEMAVSTPRASETPTTLWVITRPGPGQVEVSSVARLTVTGQPADKVGSSVGLLGDRLVIGATGRAAVQLLSAQRTGTLSFGEDGALLQGNEDRGAGEAVLSYDADADGVQDLLLSEHGDAFGFASALYLIEDPPTSGIHSIDAIARSRVDTAYWGPSSSELASGDLDGDGRADAVVSAPFADAAVGAVAVLTEIEEGNSDIEDAPIQRLGLGDDTLGWSILATDFDGDGHDDLIVGAPAAWGGAGSYKPGAVHLWYGPLQEGVEHTFTSDLLLQGSYALDIRTFHGYAMAIEDVNGDTGKDLITTSPLLGTGQINYLAGGLTGLYGF